MAEKSKWDVKLDENWELALEGKEIPAEVQTAIRGAIRHAVISTLEAHGLLNRSTDVKFAEVRDGEPIQQSG